MRNRTATILILAATVWAPGLSAQNSDRGRNGQEPEAEVLTSAVRAISRMHMESFSDSVLWEAAIDGMIRSLGDPYAELFTPQESQVWEEQTTGNYSGIGLQISPLNDEITVTGVFRGFPANAAGISVGDVIVGVNGHDAAEWSTDMAADSIRGPSGTDVAVTVRRAGYAAPLDFDVTRTEVHVPAVEHGTLPDGIDYIVMDRVARGAAEEMDEALREMGGSSRGLIIDLRSNPGGFLDESLMLADLFLTPGSTLASTVQRVAGGDVGEPETQSFSDNWPQRVPDLPIVILVDGFTASGAEILAGALQDYDRAVVLGERTFGKGVVQTVMELPYGRRLRFTTGSWLTPLGRSLQRNRDAEGRPVDVDVDMATLPRVQTPGGRSLVNGGGIFPDLDVANDTLRLAEQELVRITNELEFPLGQRLTEAGFNIAAARREAEASGDPVPTELVTDQEFSAFMATVVAQGLPPSVTEDPVARDYLRWRIRMATAARLDNLGAEANVRAERDPVLATAIQMLEDWDTQEEIYAAVAARRAQRAAAARPPSRPAGATANP